jgi:hypothetical protein
MNERKILNRTGEYPLLNQEKKQFIFQLQFEFKVTYSTPFASAIDLGWQSRNS